MRWLSKGNCLKRVSELFDTIVEFLEEQDGDLSTKIKAIEQDTFYLTDIFEKLNKVNLQLQGAKTNLIQCKSVIMSFIDKLSLYKQNLSRREFSQFPTLKKKADSITDDTLLVYSEHLQSLHQDMLDGFGDLKELHIQPWILDPFSIDSSSVDIDIQEEFSDIKHDMDATRRFEKGGYNALWNYADILTKYPLLWQRVKLLMIAFPTSYLVEMGFSKVNILLTNKRNKHNVTSGGDLRLALTKFKPDVENLCRQHQAQPSH